MAPAAIAMRMDSEDISDLGSWIRWYIEHSANLSAVCDNWVIFVRDKPHVQRMVCAYLSEVDQSGGACRGFERLLHVMRRKTMFDNTGITDIAKAVTDRKSIGKLRALARRDPSSPAATAAVMAILGGKAHSND